jgi:hypothetical protein
MFRQISVETGSSALFRQVKGITMLMKDRHRVMASNAPLYPKDIIVQSAETTQTLLTLSRIFMITLSASSI